MDTKAILLVVIHLFDLTQACTRDRISACTQQLDAYFTDSHNIFPVFDEPTLSQVCSEASSTQKCLQPMLGACNPTSLSHLNGQADAYDYICGQGKQVYLANSQCFNNWHLLEAAAVCNDTYQTELDQLAASAYYVSHVDLKLQQCSTTNKYLWCVKDAVSWHCGEETGNWQHTVNTLVLKPVLEEQDCLIAAPSLSTWEIVGIVIGAVVGFILLITFIYCIVTCVQRGKQLKQEEKYMQEEKSKKNMQYPQNRPAPQNPPTIQNQPELLKPKRGDKIRSSSSVKSPSPSQKTVRSSLKSPNMSEISRKSANEVTFRESEDPSLPLETPPPSYNFPKEA